MPGFNDIIDDLVTALRSNTALNNFCKEKWGRIPIVKKMFKFRTEIQISDLPLIFVTRPDKKSQDVAIGGDREHENTVRLYCGFHQLNRDVGQEEMIEFEELTDDAVLLDRKRNNLAFDTNVTTTVTDEGYFHPVYFVVKDVLIINY